MHNFMGAELAHEHRRELRREAESSRLAASARVLPTSGAGVQLRALTPQDAHHIVELFGRLSPRSRYLRYFAPLRKLSPRALRALADIDHDRREAVGAFDGETLIGTARYFRNDREPTTAEIAIEVADEYQRRGIGARLIHELARRGRERGITRFVATALSENSGVMNLLQQAPWPAVVSLDGPELSIAMSMPALTAAEPC
jgi:RimJ/RimL family protein N-acetyltransferase